MFDIYLTVENLLPTNILHVLQRFIFHSIISVVFHYHMMDHKIGRLNSFVTSNASNEQKMTTKKRGAVEKHEHVYERGLF